MKKSLFLTIFLVSVVFLLFGCEKKQEVSKDTSTTNATTNKNIKTITYSEAILNFLNGKSTDCISEKTIEDYYYFRDELKTKSRVDISQLVNNYINNLSTVYKNINDENNTDLYKDTIYLKQNNNINSSFFTTDYFAHMPLICGFIDSDAEEFYDVLTNKLKDILIYKSGIWYIEKSDKNYEIELPYNCVLKYFAKDSENITIPKEYISCECKDMGGCFDVNLTYIDESNETHKIRYEMTFDKKDFINLKFAIKNGNIRNTIGIDLLEEYKPVAEPEEADTYVSMP